MNIDVMTQIGAVDREVSERDHKGKAREATAMKRAARTCTFYSKLAAH